ncbi:hypothetical protein [Stieleria marina]|uniref:Secreted protein n=1 Tax=Stieleria marina TaxID=1930275 RepID=A0A517NS66_9BACT|nr:hypothetical protein K239x_19240 [Planctomycetes bacterium K23_9]
MTKTKFVLAAALLVLPMCFAGCGGSDENAVVPEAVMTEEEEASYEEQSYGSTDDASQN